MPPRKKIRVVYRKLGREKAIGQSSSPLFTPPHKGRDIELDERLKDKKLFETFLHECLHHALPTAAEEEILRIEKEIAPVMYAEIKENLKKYFP